MYSTLLLSIVTLPLISLKLEKETALRKEIYTIEKQLQRSNKNSSAANSSGKEEDSLDHYMKELKRMKLDKQTISKLKSDLSKFKQDLTNIVKLINIAKPTNLPTLLSELPTNTHNDNKHRKKLPIFGKRLKVKVQVPERIDNININIDNEEEDEEEEEEIEKVGTNEDGKSHLQDLPEVMKNLMDEKPTMPIKLRKNVADDNEKLQLEFSKIDSSIKMICPLMSNESERRLKGIWSQIKSLHPEYSERLQESIINSFYNYTNSYKFIAVIDRFKKEIDEMSDMLQSIKTGSDIIRTAQKLINLAKEITLTVNRLDQTEEVEENEERATVDELSTELDLEKKKKKNQRRIQQRQEKAEIEKRKGYEEDAAKEDYNMWVPPTGQTGDGRTSLNEKYGY